MPKFYSGGRARLLQLLLDAGTNGIKTREITHSLRHHMLSPEIHEHLEAWRAEGKVQKFVIDGKPYRPITMWRALATLEDEEEAP